MPRILDGVPDGWVTSKEAVEAFGGVLKESRIREILRYTRGVKMARVGCTRTLVIEREHLRRLVAQHVDVRQPPPPNSVTMPELVEMTGKVRQQLMRRVKRGEIHYLGHYLSPDGRMQAYYALPTIGTPIEVEQVGRGIGATHGKTDEECGTMRDIAHAVTSEG